VVQKKGFTMRQWVRLMALGVLAALLFKPATASAQIFESTLSGGYSHIYGANSPNLFYNHDGAYIDGDFAWHLPDPSSPIMAGLGIAGSGYWQTQYNPYPVFGGYYYNYNNLYSNMEDFELEPRIAARLWLPNTNFFVTFRLGAGLLVNNYAIDQSTLVSNNLVYFNTVYHTGAAFEVHPAIQSGFNWGPTSAGIDLSYITSWGDFGSFGSNQQQLRVGAFITFRY
jgi:hypothetical protein